MAFSDNVTSEAEATIAPGQKFRVVGREEVIESRETFAGMLYYRRVYIDLDFVG